MARFDSLALCVRLDQVLVDAGFLDHVNVVDLERLLVQVFSLMDGDLADFQALLVLDHRDSLA